MKKINFVEYCVYLHKCPNKKVYIGITCQNINRRWRNGKGYQNQSYFYNAIQKYGWENIEHKILFTNLTKEEAEQKEIELIKLYKSNNKKYGYNIANGGSCKESMSEETKQKIREKLFGNSNAKGYKPSIEKVEKLKLINKGNKYRLGHYHTNETKYKMKISHLNKKMSLETKIKKSKPVLQFNRNGDFIEEFYSITEASKKTKINLSNIWECCREKRKTAGNYIWKYKKGGMTY